MDRAVIIMKMGRFSKEFTVKDRGRRESSPSRMGILWKGRSMIVIVKSLDNTDIGVGIGMRVVL